jgi:hypothetical protein
MEARAVRMKQSTAEVAAVASVDGKVTAEARFRFMIVEK